MAENEALLRTKAGGRGKWPAGLAVLLALGALATICWSLNERLAAGGQEVIELAEAGGPDMGLNVEDELSERQRVVRQMGKVRGLQLLDHSARLQELEELNFCDEKTDSTCKYKKMCAAIKSKAECRAHPPIEDVEAGIKPCWYSFGSCKLRNGYGQPPGAAAAGHKPFTDKKDLLNRAVNQTKGGASDSDAQAVSKILDDLEPHYRSHLRAWSWRRHKWLHHRYNAWTIARWKRRRLYYKQWYWAYGRWGRYRTYRWRRRGKPQAYHAAEARNATADSTVDENEDEDGGGADTVKLEWCDWGEQMVPCAPGFGGAWYESGHREPDHGIWPNPHDGSAHPMHKTSTVYAGNRDGDYLSWH